MAMGARTTAILRRTTAQAAKLGVVGAVIGSVGSWGAAQWLKSLVYGISNRDPLVLLSAAVIAFIFLALAAVVPLWRSTRINLIETLHEV